jgi:Fe-Mn family superoxide dismutase
MLRQNPLKYPSNYLEPYLNSQTLEIHHGKHHKAYDVKLQELLLEFPEKENATLEEILTDLDYFGVKKTAILNNAGQVYNHNLYFDCLTNKQTTPSTELGLALDTFGSYDNFKAIWKEAGLTQFGSGWVWLVKTDNGLEIQKTSNAQSPLTKGQTAILTMDVWEHAYYLNYQNKRADYIEDFFKMTDWDIVSQNYANTK